MQAPAGGAPGERTQNGKGEDGGHAACPTPQQKDKCRATCQCRARDVLTSEEGQRGRPPHTTLNTHTHQGKERGQRGEVEGTWGTTVAGSGPPPPRAPRQGGEAEERECGTNHTTMPTGSTRRAGPNGGTTRGATGGRVG